MLLFQVLFLKFQLSDIIIDSICIFKILNLSFFLNLGRPVPGFVNI